MSAKLKNLRRMKMTQMIKLNGKVNVEELGGTKSKIVTALTKLGANKKEVELGDVKKACKSLDAKVLRQHIRDLKEDKVLTVKKVATEKAA